MEAGFACKALDFQETYQIGDQLFAFGRVLHFDKKYKKVDNWILTYRYAIRGMLARILSVDRNFENLSEFGVGTTPPLNIQTSLSSNDWNIVWESYAATLFFGMDSSLECFAHALNALGFLRRPSEFIDITDPAKLKRINPLNLFDPPSRNNEKFSIHRFCSRMFPKICSHWSKNNLLLSTIIEYHDATKHRHSVVLGQYREPPFEHLICVDPKRAMNQIKFDHPRSFVPHNQDDTLQSIARKYQVFINEWVLVIREELEDVFEMPLPKSADFGI
ncbi:hypothetical protein KIH39_03490 [Telmatocola sphagniphila]|uniref:Uncharacterized protein n=1 Tax=Telmatocola sphagniphila TaxID=1123043 RepID=A0A8E6EVS5_9BACT|nr:hypothetical protein [Telmatocola sphagniphila]QVL32992.1 hypothetical protein KIH39_03490 [Telmatocola sphagniphila]